MDGWENEWVVKAVILSWEFYSLVNVGDKRFSMAMAGRDLQCPRQLPTAKKNLLQYFHRAAVESPGLKLGVGGRCWERTRERQDRNQVNGDMLMQCPWGPRMEPEGKNLNPIKCFGWERMAHPYSWKGRGRPILVPSGLCCLPQEFFHRMPFSLINEVKD